ncbi:MAG TPA: apolipoprotein N-acyltransferase [Burkholderiales bacterium]|nr:apolipoprotein N-acyltransferase [Burkholderiales bacterium]
MSRRRLLVAFVAGAAMVPAFAPLEWFPLALAALAVLVHLWLAAPGARAAAWLGFAFGMGTFLAGVSWVYISLHRYGAMPAPLAAFATVAFCAILASYAALAGALQTMFRLPLAVRAALVIPALWTLGEWLRATLFTGFPWLALGSAAIDTPLAGFAPLGGVYALSFASALAAGLLWCMAAGQARWAAAAAFAILGLAGAALREVEWTVPAGAPVTASLVQGNVPQALKFDPARYVRTLEVHARLAEESRARLIVLPETAVPRMLDSVEPAYLERLRVAAARNGGDLLLGAPTRTAPGEYYNSVVSLGASPTQRYHKVHLVPFGEFVPPGFGWIVRVLHIPLADFSRGAATQPPLAVAGQRVAVNICYEDAYGGELIRQLPEATLLVNVSNVAWFGDSLAPAQHLQIARARALETGRMHLTATNTGITAAIGRDGAVRARLPQFAEGRLDVEVQGYAGATPYVRFADAPALALCAALLALAAVVARARGSR